MFTSLQPGRYIVAVSGGVDSVVLLDLLQRQPELNITVAHFDHGIRDDSAEDRKLAGELAAKYKLPFVYDEGHLGPAASESEAREARYRFLHTVRQNIQAAAIITAHHQDDVLETALLNLLRGTGRKGLTSLQSTDHIKRPLLHVPKHQLINYAKANGLKWREDSTNLDTRYRRNYVRSQLMTQLTAMQRHKLLAHIRYLQQLNHKIDRHIAEQLLLQPAANHLERSYFVKLPHSVSKEVLAAWLRQNGVRQFDRKGLERIVVAMKTYAPNQAIDVNQEYTVEVGKEILALKPRDR
jgi:tRNA(Ile)-lysidine synthetase-like protein